MKLAPGLLKLVAVESKERFCHRGKLIRTDLIDSELSCKNRLPLHERYLAGLMGLPLNQLMLFQTSSNPGNIARPRLVASEGASVQTGSP